MRKRLQLLFVHRRRTEYNEAATAPPARATVAARAIASAAPSHGTRNSTGPNHSFAYTSTCSIRNLTTKGVMAVAPGKSGCSNVIESTTTSPTSAARSRSAAYSPGRTLPSVAPPTHRVTEQLRKTLHEMGLEGIEVDYPGRRPDTVLRQENHAWTCAHTPGEQCA